MLKANEKQKTHKEIPTHNNKLIDTFIYSIQNTLALVALIERPLQTTLSL